MLYISPFPTLIQLIDFIGDIQYCVTVVKNLVLDRNIMFALPLTYDYLGKCFTNDDKTKVINGYKGSLKYIRFFTTGKIILLFISKEIEIMYNIKNII